MSLYNYMTLPIINLIASISCGQSPIIGIYGLFFKGNTYLTEYSDSFIQNFRITTSSCPGIIKCSSQCSFTSECVSFSFKRNLNANNCALYSKYQENESDTIFSTNTLIYYFKGLNFFNFLTIISQNNSG